MYISVIVPILNEEENIPILHGEISEVMAAEILDYEIVFVDDGSTDGSVAVLEDLSKQDSRVRLVQLRRNFGQTAAMLAGLDAAAGDVLITLDGDLQNDPADIPQMLGKIAEGYDLVHGWRKNRQDKWLTRKLPSKIANWIISKVVGFPIHDLGCTLKVMRREIAEEIELYGEMHRFIPILAHQRGAKCIEVVTNHRARRFGVSKYGLSRTIRVILDLLTVKFLQDYMTSPMKLFGRLGFGCFAVGGVSLFVTIWMKWMSAVDMTGNPLLMLTVLSTMAGIQLLSLGILGEMNSRIYFAHQEKRPYTIRRKVGFSAPLHALEVEDKAA